MSEDSRHHPHQSPDEVFETRPLSKAAARAQRRQARDQKNNPAQAKPLVGKTDTQRELIGILRQGESCFAVGPAGTGKTYIAGRIAARALIEGKVEKIIVSRATVSDPRHALGFLPGKAEQKMAPWLAPVVEAIRAEVSGATLDKWRDEGKFEVVPFEHMRGRSFNGAFIILDEAQNCSFGDLRLFLTRFGMGAQMVVTGDLEQVDIRDSGLDRVMDLCSDYDVPMDIIEFDEEDVVRSAMAKAWVRAFSQADRSSSKATSNVVDLDRAGRSRHDAPHRQSVPA